MIQDQTVNQHEHMIFIIIRSKLIISEILQLNTILQNHNYNSYLIAIMTPQRELVEHQLA